MNEFTIDQLANIITIISGSMTMLGISGIVTWGLFKRKKYQLAEKIIVISTYSIKCFLCTILLLIMVMVFKLLYIGLALLLTGKFYATSWHPFSDIRHLICYLTVSIFTMPIYMMLCLCIYDWSLHPIKKMIKLLKRQKEHNDANHE